MEKTQQCVYCGIRPATTEDHVIPRCLFDGPLPSDSITGVVKVPACQQCNNQKSRYDDYLRDMLVVDSDSSTNPIAQALLNGKVVRSGRRNRSIVLRSAFTKGQWAPRHSKGGVYIGHYYTVPLDSDRIKFIFTMIVRGLYYKKFSQRLPDNCAVEIARVDPFRIKAVLRDFYQAGCSGPYRIGNVFGCLLIYTLEEPSLTGWLMWFYDSIFFLVYTRPMDVATGNEQSKPPISE